MIQLQSREIMI